ncbi:DUF7507 domain-containing protein, partial [Aequorivita lipolytica]
MFKIITKLFASDKRFLIGLILIGCLSSHGYAQVKSSTDEGEVILPYTQAYLDQYNAALDKKAAAYNGTFRSKTKAEAFDNANKGPNSVGVCNLITCGSFEKSDVAGGTFRTAIGGTNGEYQADTKYTCWEDDGTVDWSEGQYISYSTTNANVVYPGIIEPSAYDGGGFAIFSFQNEAIRQTLAVIPNTVYTVCFEIAVIPRYNTVNSNNQGGSIIEYIPDLKFGVRNGAVQLPGGDPLTYTHANLIPHTTNDFPTRLSTATNGNGGNQNPGGWTEIDPLWENRCITFKSGPSANSVEVFYKTGNPGRSVILVDGLRLSVEGYANAPIVSPDTKTYCSATPVQLNTFVTSSTPPGAQLKWTTNPDPTVVADHLPLNPTVTPPGVWYAFYFNPALGCTSPARKLTLNLTDLASTFTKVNVSCFGLADGSIDLSVTGGSTPYSYAWTTNNGSGLNITAQDQSGLTAGTYNVTITDNNSCTAQKSITIAQPAAVNPPVSGGNQTECALDPIQTLTATATVVAGQTVVWYTQPVGGSPVSTPTLNTIGTIDYYAEAVVNNSGCKSPVRTKVTLKIIQTPVVDDPADVIACDSYTLPALNIGKYYTGPGGTGMQLPVGSSIASTQTIYVYAETGTTPNCSDEKSFLVTITQPITITISKIDATTSQGCNNGEATASPSGGTPPYSYQWSASANNQTTATATNLSVGTHHVFVTDTNGCISEEDVIIECIVTCDAIIAIDHVTNVLCTNDATGSATVGASSVSNPGSTFTFSWNTMPPQVDSGVVSSTVNGLTAGTYTVIVTIDGSVCPAVTQEITITEPSTPLTVTATATDEIGPNTNDGTATAHPSGGTSPYTYLWSPGGETTQTITGLSDGTYTVVVTDANGCTATATVTVSPGDCHDIIASITTTPVSCFGGSDGTATAHVTGGVGPFSYIWSPVSQTTQTITGLVAGEYLLQIVDAGTGCFAKASAVVTQPFPLNIEILSQTNPLCTGTGSVTVQASGGTAPYLYSLDGGTTQASGKFDNLAPGTYTIEVLDANGCTTSILVTISQNCIAIVKSGILNDENQNGCTDAGETIDYTFTVTNEGSVSLNNVTVSDPLIATITGPTGDTDGDGELDVTEIWLYTGTYNITQADIDTGQVTNQAIAIGIAPDATVVTDLSDDNSVLEDDPTVIILCQNPDIAIVKTGILNDENQNGCTDVDETISYTFTVTNEGNLSLSNITVTDPLILTISGPTGDTDGDGELDVTEIWVYTGTYTITQDDIDTGSVTNQATAVGTPPTGDDVEDQSGTDIANDDA